MPTKVLVLRHVLFEDLGSLGPILTRRGAQIRYADAGIVDWAELDPIGPDLMVVLGGPIGVYETDAYPFLPGEIALIERRLRANRPTLGICLGAQLIAAALGARVFPAGIKEIGWAPVQLTAAGMSSCLAPLSDGKPVLHWHGDTYDLPVGATHLAASDKVEQQAFAWGKSTLAVQFHPEFQTNDLERWLIGHTVELGLAQIDPRQLRRETARHGATLEGSAEAIFSQWLDASKMAE